MTTSTYSYAVLGNFDLTGLYSGASLAFTQLPDGDLFVLQYVNNETVGTMEFLEPGANSITNVTAEMSSGALPSNIGSMVSVNLLDVGDSTLPDIVLADGGPDQAPWYGGQVRLLGPNTAGQYVDETSLLPQQLAYNHRLSTGEIDGQAAIAVSMINTQTGKPVGIELLVATADGTFANWSSHLPANIASIAPGGTYSPGTFTSSAIADITGSGAGDIFLGGDQLISNNVVLVNNGSGDFHAVTVTAPKPILNGGSGGAIALYELPTQFQGDTHQDMIVVYANGAYNQVYLQFLKGDGTGNFTDVTSAHLAVQPSIQNAFGNNEWVSAIQQENINGFNDLILTLADEGSADGGAIVLVNNGNDVYTESTVALPSNIVSATWGADAGVQGFYGLNSSNQWVFVPISSTYMGPVDTSVNAPLTSQIHLYGQNVAGATTQAQTFDTTINVTLHSTMTDSGTQSFNVYVNGKVVGSDQVANVGGFVWEGQTYTTDQTFTFNVSGLPSISSLQIVSSQQTSINNLFVGDVAVNGVDLSGSNAITDLNQWNGTTDTVSASAWNSALADRNLGTSANPIVVTGGGGDSAVYVLGNHTQYTETGIGTQTIQLSESAGLDQNAQVTDVSYIVFQDNSVLNTQTGAWTTTTPTESVGQALAAQASYVSTIAVSDTAANVSSSIAALEAIASGGHLGTITLTDSGIPTISVTAAQLSSDATVLNHLSSPSGYVIVSTDASSPNLTITGIAGQPNVVDFTGAASQYSIMDGANGAITVTDISTGRTSVDTVSGVQQLQFADHGITVEATGSNGEYAALLYQAALNRSPDPSGLDYWTGASSTQSWSQISAGFVYSAEFQAKYGSLTNNQFVTQLYANVLDRSPDSGGFAYWTNAMANGESREQVLDGFAFSAEAINNATHGFTGQSGQHAAWLFLG